MTRKNLQRIKANLQAFRLREEETGAVAYRLEILREIGLKLVREVERLKDRVKQLRDNK
jgi:hypothetical protein